jgi:hypothetical protein
MPVRFTALIYVLLIATPVFLYLKPIVTRFTSEADYLRRRNIWFALTVTGFLSPSFWLFALVAAPLLMWGGRKDSNPVAFYLLLMLVIPDTPVQIPVVGINELFALNLYRLLSFFVLIPAAVRLRRSMDHPAAREFTTTDWLVLGFGALQLFLYVPPDLPHHQILHNSATNIIRQALLFYVDVYVLYYVVSRWCSTRQAVVDAMASFCVACAVLAPLAVFESVRHWLLYLDISVAWDVPVWVNAYLLRGHALRAQVTAGHAIALGYLLAVALGFWLYLSAHVPRRVPRIAITTLLVSGLVVTYSRGPWLGALVIYTLFTVLRPRAFTRAFQATMAALLLAWGLSFTEVGQRIANSLPFIGAAAESESAVYRQRLAVRAWQLFQQNPLFGDQLAVQKMEDLRQGEGIIDLVNTYVQVGLFYGIVGLALFLSPVMFACFGAARQARRLQSHDPDFSSLGNTLAACELGTLVVIATASFGPAITNLFYVLLGLTVAFVRMARANPGTVRAAEEQVLQQS